MKKKNTLDGLTAPIAFAVVAILAACSSDTTPASRESLVYGPSAAFGQGSARTWVRTDALGAVSEVGIALTESALTGLPTTVSSPNPTAVMASLALPAEAAPTGIDHAELGYNPNGHDPVQIYGLPHFDLHFYTVSMATQMAILPLDPQFGAKAANLPPASFVPVGYVPPPAPIAASAIPQMGIHWTDTKSSEFNGQPFTSTFIYGSWDGKFIFLEPMITKAYLQTHPTFTRAIPQPAQWPAAGMSPTTFGVTYDATAKEFRIVLAGFTKHGS